MPAKKSSSRRAPTKGGKAKKNPLFVSQPRTFGIGQSLRPKKDMTRFVRWPQYVKLQRQRRVLLARVKVPPTVNQFNITLDKASAATLFKLLHKYRPETRSQKTERLQKAAASEVKGQAPSGKKRLQVKYGLNHVTALVEQKKAKLVVIAHDVDPLELVIWLPALCRKMGVPYMIVKSKARLGKVVRKKTATCLAVVQVEKEDTNALASLAKVADETFNQRWTDLRKNWGGGHLGVKSGAVVRIKERALAREQAKLAGR